MDDNYSLWLRHEAERERQLAMRPKCSYCEEHIQDDHYYDIGTEVICPRCMEVHFRKEIED